METAHRSNSVAVSAQTFMTLDVKDFAWGWSTLMILQDDRWSIR